MEGELKNMFSLWVLTSSSLFYCYHISSKISKGFPRLVSIFPVMILLLILPFNMYTFHLGTAHVCFLLLANFKLILFVFDQGPLLPLPTKPHIFIITAVSPFKIKIKKGETEKPFRESANKAMLLVLLFCSYNFKQYFHKHVLSILYFFHVYISIQLLMAVGGIPAQIMLPDDVELEPLFNTPVRATSLQDFWGHRWNLRVTETLRSTIYNPTKTITTSLIGPRWASLPAVLATFVISGLMHELIYYHVIREKPTWEVTCFFVLQGVFVDVEIFLKKKLVATGKFRLHEAISGPLTLANIALTAACLSYPPLLRYGIDEKIIHEFNVFVGLFKGSFA